MDKVLLKRIALIMLMVTIINAMTSVAFAYTENVNIYEEISKTPGKADSKSTDKENLDSEIPNIVGEIYENRDKNIKEFKMSDGSTKHVVYNEAVHYLDSKNKWQDIDNTVTEVYDVKGTKRYENKNNSIKVSFKESIYDQREDDLVVIESDGNKLGWNLKKENIKTDSIKETTSKIKIKNSSENQDNKKTDQKQQKNKHSGKETANRQIEENKTESMITYDEVFTGTDLIYKVVGDKVKESIILDNKNSEKEYTFELNTYGLLAKLNNDKSIEVYDESKEYKEQENKYEYKILTPYMFDSLGEISYDVNVELKEAKNGYLMTIVPDSKWLKADERVYPVTIDPTLVTSRYYNDILDGFIASDNPNNCNEGAHILRAGGGIVRITRSLIKFNLPELKSSDQVISATLALVNYYQDASYTPGSMIRQINAHKIIQNWNTSSNWNSMANAYDGKVLDYDWYNYNGTGLNTFDITEAVREWYTTNENYGILLKENTEKITGQNEAYY
ncbi:MAG: DNRLRE domain-containing protein, partial [Clostridia bacterium]|nr:DNRLRE domain-containing protein [Clostridia bacterium]